MYWLDLAIQFSYWTTVSNITDTSLATLFSVAQSEFAGGDILLLESWRLWSFWEEETIYSSSSKLKWEWISNKTHCCSVWYTQGFWYCSFTWSNVTNRLLWQIGANFILYRAMYSMTPLHLCCCCVLHYPITAICNCCGCCSAKLHILNWSQNKKPWKENI